MLLLERGQIKAFMYTTERGIFSLLNCKLVTSLTASSNFPNGLYTTSDRNSSKPYYKESNPSSSETKTYKTLAQHLNILLIQSLQEKKEEVTK